MERRNFIKNLSLGIASTFVAGRSAEEIGNNPINTTMNDLVTLEFPALPFAYDALEPYIDTRTMEIHYDKHHRAYYNNYLIAIKGTSYENLPVEKVFTEVSKAGDSIRNSGGGFYNHVFFWNNLGKGSSGPSPELAGAINSVFGSYEKFKEAFSTTAKTRFGSGWAWLYYTSDKKLAIGSTPNQENPLMDVSNIKGIPLLTLDVWEHHII
jgi:Fe-Mn family superoxide dismutase